MRVNPAMSSTSSFPGSRGFTLVELLVSVAVVSVLMIAVVTMLNGATLMSTQSRKHLDADSEARMIFDRMAQDFAGMIKRRDIDYVFARSVGNDTFFFYSEAPALADPAASTQNTCALVGYRVNAQYQLERLGKGLVWGAAPPSGMVFLTYSSPYVPSGPAPVPNSASTFASPSWSPLIGSAPAYADGASADYYHVLGDAVFRMEFCFLLKPNKQTDGTVKAAVYSNHPYNTPNYINPQAPSVPTSLYGLGTSDIEAIVVSLAILDVESRKIVSTANLGTLSGALLDPADTDLSSSPPHLMAQTWTSALNTGVFNGVPKTALANVRIYQRTFYLGSFLN